MEFTRTEPDPASQTCGYQIQVGGWDNDGNRFCVAPKATGLYFCQEHHDWVIQDEPDGIVRMAPGNVRGH
ncbi:hypothetical protein [Streptomyces lasiicapitis]|uniref:hypothetical protein n=1 Tax=Streptomyces lasiicapitis TaxID=1923961 RepID=UPI003659393D